MGRCFLQGKFFLGTQSLIRNIEESILPVLPADVHIGLINYVFPVNLLEHLICFLKVSK